MKKYLKIKRGPLFITIAGIVAVLGVFKIIADHESNERIAY